MPSLVSAVVTCGVALSLVASAPPFQSASPQTPAPAPAPVTVDTARPEMFAGTWSYNADESVNAYTGRPEQAPTRTGTTPRPGSGSSGGGRTGGSQPPSGGPGTGGSGGGTGGTNPPGTGAAGGTSQNPPTIGSAVPGMVGGLGSSSNAPAGVDPMMFRGGWAAAWARSAARDLLEVPWGLTIEVTSDAVTFIDDLDRSRTYQTDGKRRKYQLGAAVFNAKTAWDGARLRKEIDAATSFKMSETYFLSEDASRLFVIIRLGDPRQVNAKSGPPAGVNRVYDRTQPK